MHEVRFDGVRSCVTRQMFCSYLLSYVLILRLLVLVQVNLTLLCGHQKEWCAENVHVSTHGNVMEVENCIAVPSTTLYIPDIVCHCDGEVAAIFPN